MVLLVLTMRRHRWAAYTLAVIGVGFIAQTFWRVVGQGASSSVLLFALYVAVPVVLLFTPGARAWLRK